MANLAESFVGYLEDLGIATFGDDLFIGEAPSTNLVADSIWWVTASGGTPETRLLTGETVKNYLVEVFYRNRDYQAVYDAMHSLEESINADRCTQLEGFETFDIQATTFPVDQDLDAQDMKVGLLQASIRTYKGALV